jgi:hypothetical protein
MSGWPLHILRICHCVHEEGLGRPAVAPLSVDANTHPHPAAGGAHESLRTRLHATRAAIAREEPAECASHWKEHFRPLTAATRRWHVVGVLNLSLPRTARAAWAAIARKEPYVACFITQTGLLFDTSCCRDRQMKMERDGPPEWNLSWSILDSMRASRRRHATRRAAAPAGAARRAARGRGPCFWWGVNYRHPAHVRTAALRTHVSALVCHRVCFVQTLCFAVSTSTLYCADH